MSCSPVVWRSSSRASSASISVSGSVSVGNGIGSIRGRSELRFEVVDLATRGVAAALELGGEERGEDLLGEIEPTTGPDPQDVGVVVARASGPCTDRCRARPDTSTWAARRPARCRRSRCRLACPSRTDRPPRRRSAGSRWLRWSRCRVDDLVALAEHHDEVRLQLEPAWSHRCDASSRRRSYGTAGALGSARDDRSADAVLIGGGQSVHRANASRTPGTGR